ncbi:PaaI family thioesterase [Sphingomonas sp. MS122]|uniref:PaaI family thioesterase n=1 Tax=Sphingomonas sp. MS122 TaxID=3412683 RepID=UPI003C2C1E74
MNGLEQVQALLAAGKQPPIGETLAFSLVEVAKGHAVFEGVPDRRAYNPLGTVHGGYAATLLDSACGIATHTALEEGQSYTTLELKVAYHRAMSVDTGRVRATGSLLSIGRRAAFAEARLLDASGRLLASATSTLLVMTA